MIPASMPEPTHVDEPQVAAGYADVLSQVAEQGQPVIVRRRGEDLAAVIPLAHLELMRDLLARHEAERLARQMNWDQIAAQSPPPQHWFEGDEPKPF
jgi:PHD/YefM family antitoxin component YafN of YafNO toxin-antitoxin module